jgi:hypothetical protein
MQRQICFFKVCFFPWLAGRFHNFELTQNGEKKQEMALLALALIILTWQAFVEA